MTGVEVFAAALLVSSAPPALPTPAESAAAVIAAALRLDAPFVDELDRRLASADDARDVWQLVGPHTLLEVEINPEMRVKGAAGRARPVLIAGQPQAFFVRVDNACGTTARLTVTAADLATPDGGAPDWLEVEVADVPGCTDRLSGAPVEYKLLICRAASPGRREARLGLDAGQGTQDLGFRGVVDILFHVRPADPLSGD